MERNQATRQHATHNSTGTIPRCSHPSRDANCSGPVALTRQRWRACRSAAAAAAQRPLPLPRRLCRLRGPRGARLLSPVTASHRVAAPLGLAAARWCCHCCICCADATCCVATGRAVATRYAVPMHCSMGWPCRVRARCNASMRSARASCATVRRVSLCVSLYVT